jgi:hypothetical protein
MASAEPKNSTQVSSMGTNEKPGERNTDGATTPLARPGKHVDGQRSRRATPTPGDVDGCSHHGAENMATKSVDANASGGNEAGYSPMTTREC